MGLKEGLYLNLATLRSKSHSTSEQFNHFPKKPGLKILPCPEIRPGVEGEDT